LKTFWIHGKYTIKNVHGKYTIKNVPYGDKKNEKSEKFSNINDGNINHFYSNDNSDEENYLIIDTFSDNESESDDDDYEDDYDDKNMDHKSSEEKKLMHTVVNMILMDDR
jgi:hypothetical protein